VKSKIKIKVGRQREKRRKNVDAKICDSVDHIGLVEVR
jgi:hypothetical protein